MKKILVVALVMSLLLGCTVAPASACMVTQPLVAVAVNDGGSGSGRNSSSNTNTTTQTASSGGINQNATVQGDGNAVNIRQTVNRAGDSYTVHQNTTVVNNTTIIQVVEPQPEPPRPDYAKMKETIAIYGSAFIDVLSTRLHAEGWTLLWSVDTVQTHNYVLSVSFISTNLTLKYKLMYYTADAEHYTVALSTAYHQGWRIADYPASEIVFRGLSEAEAIEMIINWLFIHTEISVTPACSCCAHCTCNGACGTGCSCGE